jgi:hypothetical protein
VLERGKHDELLSKEDGAYTRLVIAQRLREARDVTDVDEVIGQSSGKAAEDHTDVEKAALEEIPLGRKNTHRSLASEILEQRKGQGSEEREKEYSLFYLFKRMGRINKGEWKSYLLGCISFIGEFSWLNDLDCLLTICSMRSCLSRLRYCLVCVQCHYCFPAGMVLTVSCLTQLTLSQVSQIHPLKSAATLATVMPFGVSFLCITCLNFR